MTRARIAVVGAAVVACAQTTAGCSSGHVDHPDVSAPPSVPITGTAAGEPPNPCTLLTTAQIAAVFGGQVSTGARPASSTRTECDWTITGSKFGSGAKVVLYYPSNQSSAAFHAAKAGLPDAQPVVELGTDAYYLADQAAMTVLVGENQFTVQAVLTSKPDPVAVEDAVMAVARNADAAY